MARTVKDAYLATRTARANLPARKRPHYRLILQGLHLGYYRGSRTGSWSARRFIGHGRYQETKLGAADDVADADGVAILTFGQAQEQARAWFTARALADAGYPDPLVHYTVSDALDDYERDYVRRGGKAVGRLRHTVTAHIRPILGSLELEKLTRAKIESCSITLLRRHLGSVAGGVSHRNTVSSIARPKGFADGKRARTAF